MSAKLFCLLGPVAVAAISLRSSSLPTDPAINLVSQELMEELSVSGSLQEHFEGLTTRFKYGLDNMSPEDMSEMENAVAEFAKQAEGKDESWLGGEGSPVMASVKTIKKIVGAQMIPTIEKAHQKDQDLINKIVKEATHPTGSCKTIKDGSNTIAAKEKATFDARSKSHKQCRVEEASLATEKTACEAKVKTAKAMKELHCKALKTFKDTRITQAAYSNTVKKVQGESDDSYVDRIHASFCGNGKDKSIKAQYTDAKKKCSDATAALAKEEKQCAITTASYKTKKTGCDSVQLQMDNAACTRASLIKDACEGYAGCYSSQNEAWNAAKNTIAKAAGNRDLELEAASRILCLIDTFTDGKVERKEIDDCRNKKYPSTLKITYTPLPKMETCTIPDTWPVTAQYRAAQLAPLPALAKSGAIANAEAHKCAGMMAISTLAKNGSPKGCKCMRLTMNGVYSPGPIVKCTGCLDVSKANQKNSCPYGTKIFSPRSEADWKTFVASAPPLKAPHMIIDISSKSTFTATGGTMNSVSAPTWKTSDGSPWWLRSKASPEPKGSYYANCYLGLTYGAAWGGNAFNNIQFDADNCKYHSSSYYCQKNKVISTKPKDGSPKSCACSLLELKGKYSAEALLKCENCLDVSKSTQKNSCPTGTKLWAPRNRDDWKTFLASGLNSLRAPHWIVDVTNTKNGPGCCGWSAKNYNFNSGKSEQGMWKTADGAPWWLRSTKYNEPNGDYKANCYLDLWRNPSTPDDVQWNDGNCNYHSKSYYCQPVHTPAPPPTPPPPPPPSPPSPPVNVALNMPAKMSTHAGYGDGAKEATDGVTKNDLGTGTAHTHSEMNAWIEVDLKDKACVLDNVVVWNGWNHCCRDRINPFVIKLKDAAGKEVFTTPNLKMNPSVIHEAKVVKLGYSGVARYVRVQLAGHKNYLHLAEIQAYCKGGGAPTKASWYLGANINPSDGHNFGYGGPWEGKADVGSADKAFSRDFLSSATWSKTSGYVAIARHINGKCEMSKTWKLSDSKKSMRQYFSTYPGRLTVTGDGGIKDQHIHADIKGSEAGLAQDPIFGASGGLVFNWQYSNNGARIAVPGAYKIPYKLPSAHENNDDVHGLGNEFGASTTSGKGSSSWWHDAGQKQGDCHGGSCKVVGKDHGTSMRTGDSWGGVQYAIYVSKDATSFSCRGRKLEMTMAR